MISNSEASDGTVVNRYYIDYSSIFSLYLLKIDYRVIWLEYLLGYSSIPRLPFRELRSARSHEL
jgi:hypothetical protein